MTMPTFPPLSSHDGFPVYADTRLDHIDDPINGLEIVQKLKLKVFLNGEDVTNRCFSFNREADMVGLYKRNEQGQFYTEIGPDGDIGIAQEWKQGEIVLAL